MNRERETMFFVNSLRMIMTSNEYCVSWMMVMRLFIGKSACIDSNWIAGNPFNLTALNCT